MSLNISKSSLQRVYEYALRTVRTTTEPVVAIYPADPASNLTPGGKIKLGLMQRIEQEARLAADFAAGELTSFKSSMEVRFQNVALDIGVTYKAPGQSTRA